MDDPWMITMPPSMGNVPLNTLISVDFPEPLGPMILVMPCLGMAMDR